MYAHIAAVKCEMLRSLRRQLDGLKWKHVCSVGSAADGQLKNMAVVLLRTTSDLFKLQSVQHCTQWGSCEKDHWGYDSSNMSPWFEWINVIFQLYRDEQLLCSLANRIQKWYNHCLHTVLLLTSLIHRLIHTDIHPSVASRLFDLSACFLGLLYMKCFHPIP